VEVRESSNPASLNSVEAISASDALHTVASDGPRRVRALFFSMRSGIFVLFGVASGTFTEFYGFATTNYLLALGVAGVAIVAAAVVLVKYLSKPLPPSYSTLLPFQLAFVLISVYMGTESDVYARIAIGMAWLVAHIFSLNELPSYREMTNVDAVGFAYLEKASMLIPYSLSAGATSLIVAPEIYPRYAEQVDVAVVYYMLMMVFIYGIALTRHILIYYPKAVKEPTDSATEASPDLSHVSLVAERHSLTKREAEVLLYLSRGYSRPYIEKRLYISKGTAKTHIFRIFQKLGVTSQDELIELVEKG
jgi:DNA-binding CsgD family transcriptional regulator